jgi:hypothetical protein
LKLFGGSKLYNTVLALSGAAHAAKDALIPARLLKACIQEFTSNQKTTSSYGDSQCWPSPRHWQSTMNASKFLPRRRSRLLGKMYLCWAAEHSRFCFLGGLRNNIKYRGFASNSNHHQHSIISSSSLPNSIFASLKIPTPVVYYLHSFRFSFSNNPTSPPTFNMQYSSVILCAAFAVTSVFSHGVITEVKGANGNSDHS